MKRIYQHPWWFHLVDCFHTATEDPDLIYAAPLLVVMGFLLPWLLRFLALIIGPALVALGIVLFVVAIVRGVQRVIHRFSPRNISTAKKAAGHGTGHG
jgi:hypothetical protein